MSGLANSMPDLGFAVVIACFASAGAGAINTTQQIA
jgi:hypothetical protein